jgi:transketolase
MIGAAVGLQTLGKRPFAATFGAFMTRAYDFIRMAAVGRADIALSGSHAGVSIGEDGPSQMALEDLAMMRAVHGSTVLYPADGNSTAKLVAQTADLEGVTYVRTTREKTNLLYDAGEDFPIGGSKVLRSSMNDSVTLVGAGVTVFESLKAADELAQAGINARVIDAYSVKPIDVETLRSALEDTSLIVVTEDHWLEGGLGDAVLSALAADGRPLTGRVIKLGVSEMPGSGKPEELRDWAGISAARIAAAAKKALA